ncbi:hypothetical protein B0H13DRAFT_2332099 [Mycena leptocephala]|nr:hypothetical protein B0H13DRAFT_2332099 [Mycena leptocephala]
MSNWFFGSRVTPSVDLNEILQLTESHTGQYLAERAFECLERFGIAGLYQILAPHFDALRFRIYCFCRINSLVAKMFISFFSNNIKRRFRRSAVARSGNVQAGAPDPAPVVAEEELALDEDDGLSPEERELAQTLAHDEAVIRSVRDRAIADMAKRKVKITDAENKTALGLFPKVAGLARRVHDSALDMCRLGAFAPPSLGDTLKFDILYVAEMSDSGLVVTKQEVRNGLTAKKFMSGLSFNANASTHEWKVEQSYRGTVAVWKRVLPTAALRPLERVNKCVARCITGGCRTASGAALRKEAAILPAPLRLERSLLLRVARYLSLPTSHGLVPLLRDAISTAPRAPHRASPLHFVERLPAVRWPTGVPPRGARVRKRSNSSTMGVTTDPRADQNGSGAR